MNRQEAQKIIFDVLNHELLTPQNDTGTMSWNIVRALGFENEPEPKPALLYGFALIGEMTKAELVEECIAFQTAQWSRSDVDSLKQYVIQARLHDQRVRLEREAHLEPPRGFAGMLAPRDDS